MPVDKYESVQPDVTVYCIVQLINLMIEFYDEIAGGYFRFEHNELPTVNDLLNRELGCLINHLNKEIGTDFESGAAYPKFNYTEVTESWFDRKKPEMLTLKSQIEVCTAPGSGGSLPRQFGIVMTTVTPKVKDYARLRAKWDAEKR